MNTESDKINRQLGAVAVFSLGIALIGCYESEIGLPNTRNTVVRNIKNCSNVPKDYDQLQAALGMKLDFTTSEDPWSDMEKIKRDLSFRSLVDCAVTARLRVAALGFKKGGLRENLAKGFTYFGGLIALTVVTGTGRYRNNQII